MTPFSCFSKTKRRSCKTRSVVAFPEEFCRRFSLAELRNNLLTCRIGVSKGYIDDGATTVAIRCCTSPISYRTEVQLLCQLRHPNLVPLIGFCEEEGEQIIVYEYMTNMSLHYHLFSRDRNETHLTWERRLHICIGAARGLHYLHSGVKQAIIHRDVKPSSILLDENWVAKLSNLGLSKLGPVTMSNALIRLNSKPTGTFGYLEPEYLRDEQLTEKSDVYSFGVVLFVVLSGRQPNEIQGEEDYGLIGWAETCMRVGAIDRIINPLLVGTKAPDCLCKFVETATSCVFNCPTDRPAMGEVVVSLELALEMQLEAAAGMDFNYENLQFCPDDWNLDYYTNLS